MHTEYSLGEKIKITTLVTAFETNYKRDFYFKGEYHDFWEMVYVISGQAGVSADGTVYELSEGELIIHKPLEFHKLWALGEGRMQLLIMSFKAEGDMLSHIENFAAKLNYSQRELVGKLLLSLRKGGMHELDEYGQINYLKNWEKGGIRGQMVKNYMELLFLSICDDKSAIKKHSDMRGAEIYMQLVRVMEDSIYDWPSVDEIAARCSFSSSYIKKVFKKYASCGIHEYFIKMKIKKAVSLMENGYSIRQTSEKLSFGNENYFGVVFKREIGVSPSQFMRRM